MTLWDQSLLLAVGSVSAGISSALACVTTILNTRLARDLDAARRRMRSSPENQPAGGNTYATNQDVDVGSPTGPNAFEYEIRPNCGRDGPGKPGL